MKQKKEFSKIIFIMVTVWAMIITLFTMIMIAVTGDTSSLEFLIGAIFAEMATATGFYYSKAKAENRIKLQQQYGMDAYSDSDIYDDLEEE